MFDETPPSKCCTLTSLCCPWAFQECVIRLSYRTNIVRVTKLNKKLVFFVSNNCIVLLFSSFILFINTNRKQEYKLTFCSRHQQPSILSVTYNLVFVVVPSYLVHVVEKIFNIYCLVL